MIELRSLNKKFRTKDGEVDAVKDVSLTIEDGDIFGIIGFSGAGKSTLVRCINLLERPDSGRVLFEGTDLTALSEKELRKQRYEIGMIFQQFNLLDQRTVLKNVTFPLEIKGVKKEEAEKKALDLLQIVGLSDRANVYPATLSGGQKQRVGIARALATEPKVLLCDEATSALDPITTRSILALLKKINATLGVTIVIITHEMAVIRQVCNHVAVIKDGAVQEEGPVRDIFLNPKSQAARELILPEALEAEPEGRPILRIAFEGQSSSTPYISRFSIENGAELNILGANTEEIGDQAYGQMLIERPADPDVYQKLISYLDENGIYHEET